LHQKKFLSIIFLSQKIFRKKIYFAKHDRNWESKKIFLEFFIFGELLWIESGSSKKNKNYLQCLQIQRFLLKLNKKFWKIIFHEI